MQGCGIKQNEAGEIYFLPLFYLNSPKKEVRFIKDKLRINEYIRSREVRLIDAEGGQVGIVNVQDALIKAQQAGLDLVEVAPDAVPPVCRIMDYSKLLYDQKKKMKDARKKGKSLEVKEVKMRPKIDPHDFQVKINHIKEFLEKGHKVKITLMFRGREMAYQEIGDQLLDKLIAETQEVATADWESSKVGRIRSLILTKK